MKNIQSLSLRIRKLQQEKKKMKPEKNQRKIPENERTITANWITIPRNAEKKMIKVEKELQLNFFPTQTMKIIKYVQASWDKNWMSK